MERLRGLHLVDAQVRGLRRRLDTAQRYLSVQERQLTELQSRHDELTTRKRHVQATIANAEVELTSHDERIEKLRDELNSANTNKQYAAILTELNTIKDLRSGVEDRMLAEMEKIEQLDVDVEAIDGRLEERRTVRDQARGELEERRNEIGDRLAELEHEREEAASAVPDRELGIFEHLARDYEGEAMAAVDEVDRRNRAYACGACNMQLPFEQVSLLLSAADTLVQCHACHRILFLEEETRTALVKK
jgi:predicted  nucleic acid-binding Zn-ribbon protein